MSGALADLAGPDDRTPDDQEAEPYSPPGPLERHQMLPFRPRAEPGVRPLQTETPQRKPLLKQAIVERYARWMTMKNVADDLDDDTRQKITDQAKREFTIDDESCSEWKTQYRKWLDFALQIAGPKNYPWPNASNVIYPMITVAALQFNARAYPAIVQGRNVVKGTVVGDDRGVALMVPIQQGGAPPGAAPPGPGQGSGGPTGGPTGGPPTIAAPQGGPTQLPHPQQPNSLTGPPGGGVSTSGTQPAMGQDGRPVWIVPPGAKQARADKIGRHMSWQLLTEMPEWEEQTDRLLIVEAIVGTMFRKNYYDPSQMRNVSETVDALRLVVNYKAKSFDVAPRVTELIDVYPWDIETNIRAGLWLDEDYGTNHDVGQDEQAPVTFCEQHRRYDIDGDGYDEPVIVTFSRDTGKLARIAVCFDEEGIEATRDGEVQRIQMLRYYTKYGFLPNPDGGVYDIGFGHLLYPLNAAVNTSLNQMFDAGHLQIAGGGFIGSGMSINTGSVRFTTGEYKVINTQGRALRENLVPLQMPGPNPVLLQMMEFLVESAKDVGGVKDVLTGDLPGANVPGILGLAMIQQGLKVFNAIFKRVHRSLRADYEKLFRLNRMYLADEQGFRLGSEYFQISRSDYEDGGGCEPVSDPEMVTDVQQMAQANFLLQFAQDPFFDGREIRLRVMQAAAVQQVDKLIAAQSPPNAEMLTNLAQLDLGKQQMDINRQEADIKLGKMQLEANMLQIREQREQAELAIQRGKDKAIEIRELSTAILNLANARAADAEADQNWYALQLTNLRHQIDLLNITSTTGSAGENPSTVGVDAGAAAGIAGGLASAGVPGLAPPSGQPAGPAVP
jgi:chaperonin GroES